MPQVSARLLGISLLSIALWGSGASQITARPSLPAEHEVKAVFLYNFIRFVASVALGVYDRRRTTQLLQEDALQLVSLLATNSAAALLFNDQESAGELLAGLRSQSDVRAVAIYDADGRSFASFRTTLRGNESLPITDEFFFTEDLFVVYQRIALDGETLGTIHAEIDLASMKVRTNRFVGLVALLMLGLPACSSLRITR